MAVATPKTSSAPGTALTYITVGAVLTVFSGASYLFFRPESNGNNFLGYLRLCALLLGIVLLVIGFAVGQIGRNARRAELLPEGAVPPTPAQASPNNMSPPPPSGPSGAAAAGSIYTMKN